MKLKSDPWLFGDINLGLGLGFRSSIRVRISVNRGMMHFIIDSCLVLCHDMVLHESIVSRS